MQLNKVVIGGNICRDPELKQTVTGNSFVQFTVAVAKGKNSEGKDLGTNFIQVQAWRNKAEFICKHFKKGDLIIVCGFIDIRQYEDKNGVKRESFAVVVDEVQFAGMRREQATQPAVDAPPPTREKNDGSQPFDTFQANGGSGEEDLPF